MARGGADPMARGGADSMARGAYAGLTFGFAAGFLAVLLFHQPAIGVLHTLGLVSNPPYSVQAVGPLGVPRVLSLSFWGGVWGMVFAVLRPYLPRRGAGFVLAGLVFGAVFPTLYSWFALRGWPPASYWRGPLINGAYGLGLALILRALDRLPRR